MVDKRSSLPRGVRVTGRRRSCHLLDLSGREAAAAAHEQTVAQVRDQGLHSIGAAKTRLERTWVRVTVRLRLRVRAGV